MNDLSLQQHPNLPEYSVSELSAALKRSIEENFGHVRVKGEVSGWKRVGSGHCYFALKDSEAVLDAVCWRGTATRLSVQPEDGMEVVCTGRLTTYASRSRYQLVVEAIELAGIGALLKLLEDRRRRLAAEGLFAAERKKKIPFLPEVVGVVTSPSGAVIRDILHRLADRFPRRVLLWPVAVQGEGAAAQIAEAIAGFNRLAPGGAVPRPDVLIVARGGGSLEDLMPFNEEIVVRAAALSAIPLISAVGHETDTTLIDHAADRRAPTPTAAAELAVPVRLDLIATVESLKGRLSASLARLLSERRLHLAGLARGLPDPQDLIGLAAQRLDDRAERLHLAIRHCLALDRERLANVAARLRPEAAVAEIGRARALTAEAGRRLDQAAVRAIGDRQSALDDRAERLHLAIRHCLALDRERLANVAARLRPEAAVAEIARARALTAEAGRRLGQAALRAIESRRSALDNFAGRLKSHSERHESLLARGYVVVRDRAAQVVTVAAAVAPGAPLDLEFHDGRVGVTADGAPRLPARKPAAHRQPAAPPAQGRLFG